MIIHNNHIQGIKLGNHEYKLTQYANNTTFVFDGSNTSFCAILNTLDRFSSFSGLNINLDKCLLVGLGSLKYHYNFFTDSLGISWNRGENFLLLGINFNINISDMPSICINQL